MTCIMTECSSNLYLGVDILWYTAVVAMVLYLSRFSCHSSLRSCTFFNEALNDRLFTTCWVLLNWYQVTVIPFLFQVLSYSPVWRDHVLGREWHSPAQCPLLHIDGVFHPLTLLDLFFLVTWVGWCLTPHFSLVSQRWGQVHPHQLQQ